MNRLRTTARGFTVLEIMFVLIIIGVIGAIVGYNLLGQAEKAKEQATRTSMDVVKKALITYRATYNSYPTTDIGLQALVQDKLLLEHPRDGWSKELEYYAPTPTFPNGFELISAGPDMVSGTADDIKFTSDPQ